MSASPTPTAAAATSRTTSPINYLFLVEAGVAVIVAVAFLFYWNRLLGNVLSWFIRLYTWRRHNAYINIGSLQISPLAGRVLFRDVHYHSSNLSLRVMDGHVTWRYWKRRVRQESSSNNPKRRLLPCRISIFAEGVELFVYNRTPAYDAIVERMKRHEAGAEAGPDVDISDGHARFRKGWSSQEAGASTPSSKEGWSRDSDPMAYPPQTAVRTRSGADSTSQLRRTQTKEPKPTISWFREALPIELNILTGAVVLGNDATPMVLVIDFKEGDGTIEASPSRSPLDYYKFGINLSFRALKVLMRTNTDYTGPLLNHGKQMYDKLAEENPNVLVLPPSAMSLREKFKQMSSKFAFLYVPDTSPHPLFEHRPWKGLARYREGADKDTAFGRGSHEIEYAKVTTLLDSPSVDVSVYYDEPGEVLQADRLRDPILHKNDQFGNGDIAPEYGIDVVIHGGSVKYGPWADRQRDALQKAFAPSIFFNTEPHPGLEEGEKRVATALKVGIRLDEETVLRLPTRESSKDWQYDTKRGYRGKVRPYGWLDVKVGPNSYITYVQSQIATIDGYDSLLELHLDGITMVTSVNMQTFMTANVCRLSLSMPTPLRWNEERTWDFDLTMERPEIWLLRDHVTLIADLAKDWSSGSTGDFFHFVPNHYKFQVALKNYYLRLNLNDYNIVDRPTSKEDNAFATLTGPKIGATVEIAAKYRPEFSTIPFTVDAKDATLFLSLPQWDTHASFETGRSEDIGRIGDIQVTGTYLYYAMPHPSHQETLTLDIKSSCVSFKCLGWVLRRLFCIKDNYFGNYTNFTTFSEFKGRFAEDPKLVGDRVEDKYRPGRSDSFAVNLTAQVYESRIILPENIFDCVAGAFLPVPEFQLTLRSVDEFMEMSIDIQPTYVGFFEDLNVVYPQSVLPSYSETEVVFLEGVEIKAHRLFGPQPRALTYLCLWEIRIAAVQAHLTPSMIHKLQGVGRAFAYNFTDEENAPSAKFVPPPDPDVTFFKLEIDVLRVTVLDSSTPASALQASFPAGITLDTSSLATDTFDSSMALCVPAVDMLCLFRDDKASRWREVGLARTDLQVDVFKAPHGWRDHAFAQQSYVSEQDRPTGRTKVLYTAKTSSSLTTARVVHLPRPYRRASDFGEGSSDESFTDESSITRSESMGTKKKFRRSFTTARESNSGDSIGIESGEESDYEIASDSTTKSHLIGKFSKDERLSLGRGDEMLSQGWMVSADIPRQGGPAIEELPTQGSALGSEDSSGEVIRIRSRGGVTFYAEPVIAVLATLLLRRFNEFIPSTESFLDQLLVAEVDAQERESAAPVSRTRVIDFDLPSLDLRVSLQNGADNASQASEIAVRLHAVAALSETKTLPAIAAAHHITCRVQSLCVQLTSGADEDGAIRLQDAGCRPCVPMASDDFLACCVSFEDLRFDVMRTESTVVGFYCGAMDVQTVHHTVVLVEQIRSLLADLSLSKASESAENRRAALRADITWLLHDAIHSGRSTVNPNFMDVEASALHADGQASIRRSLGWMTLSRFRHWLREYSGFPRLRNAAAGTEELPFTAEDIIRRLANLKEWEPIEREDVCRQEFLQIAFPDILPTSDDKVPTQSSIRTHLESLRMDIHGIDLSAKSIATTSLNLARVTVSGIHNNLEGVDVLAIGAESCGLTAATNLLHLTQTIASLLPAPSAHAEESKLAFAAGAKQRSRMVLTVHVQMLAFEANASGLRAALASQNLQVAIAVGVAKPSVNSKVEVQESLTYTVSVQQIELRADGHNSNGSPAPSIRSLVSVLLEGVSVYVDIPIAIGPCSVLLSTTNIEIQTKPKLRSLYLFVESWREKHLATYEAVFAEFGALSPSTEAQSERSRRGERAQYRETTVDIRLVQATVRIRASRALSLSWEIGGSIGSITRHLPEESLQWSYAVKLGPQALGVASSSSRAQTAGIPTVDSSTLLRLPWVQVFGTHGIVTRLRPVEHVLSVSLGHITGTAKPALFERVLSLHEHLGHDIQSFIETWEKARHKNPQTTEAVLDTGPGPTYQAAVSVAGLYFSIRADGVASHVVLKTASLTGKVNNSTRQGQLGLSWSADVKDLALALGRPTRLLDDPLESRHSSAYMILSLNVEEVPSTRLGSAETDAQEASLNISITPIHAVIHVAALSEVLDLGRTWSAELSELHSRRAPEVSEFRSNTTRVLKTLEPADSALSDSSWFAKRTVTLQLAGLGIAIPLVEVSVMTSGSEKQVPEFSALLFAIHSVSFTNKRNETAKSTVQHLSLQFVSRFNQMNTEHFRSLAHQSKNKMSLPDMESRAQMCQSSGHWEVYSHSTASGFQLGLAPNITDHVFALMDLYENGRLHFALLEEQYRKEVANFYAMDDSAASFAATKPTLPQTKTSMRLRGSFKFNSGTVTLHPPMDSATPMATSRASADIIKLPTVSVWSDYSASSESSDDMDDLLVNIAVHSSMNDVNPTVLPFCHAIARGIALHLNSASERRASRPPLSHMSSSAETAPGESASQAVSKPTPKPLDRTKYQLSLRIDQSKLRFQCLDGSKAYACLEWADGGFLVSHKAGKSGGSTLAGTVSGVGLTLGHTFRSETSFLTGRGKDLTFSATQGPDFTGPVYVAVDTELSTSFNMGLYFAWLGFVAVWWDPIPVIDLRRPAAVLSGAVQHVQPAPSSMPPIVLTVRVRRLEFDADVTVSKLNLGIQTLVASGTYSTHQKELQLSITEVQGHAVGDVAGKLHNTGFNIHTHRQAYARGLEVDNPVFLNMAVSTGETEFRLDVDHQTILRAHLANTVISLADDWSGFSPDSAGERSLKLAFGIDAGRFDGVITLLAIPQLLRRLSAISGTMDDQKIQAMHDSSAFRARRSVKAKTAGSGIAAAMLKSAKEHTKDSSFAAFKVIQAVRFDLAGIDLGVYSADIHESDFYRFKVGRVGADQSRDRNQAGEPERRIELLIAYMTWETSDRGRAPKEEHNDLPVAQWIQRAASHDRREVASVPSLTLSMNSTELSNPPVLDYDFDLIWGETDGDIAFLPNFFDTFKKTYEELMSELDKAKLERLAEKQRRARLEGVVTKSDETDVPAKKDAVDGKVELLVYRDRSLTPRHNLPRLKPLGEGTTDAARLLPIIKTGMAQIPLLSHRFVTLKLEELMDMMLKLYEKQLDASIDQPEESSRAE